MRTFVSSYPILLLLTCLHGFVIATDQGESSEADQATVQFVRSQQPELANLLEFLKSKRPSDYRSAMDEIHRTRERLENLKRKEPELHDVELAIWQNSAQLRLWAASVSVTAKKLNEADRTKLTALLTQENELTLQRLKIDKARAEARLEQLKQQITRRQDQVDSVIAKGIKNWESRIERPSGKLKNKTPTSDEKATSKNETKTTNE